MKRSGEHPTSPRHEKESGDSSEPQAFRRGFFQEHEQGEDRDPPHVHHAGHGLYAQAWVYAFTIAVTESLLPRSHSFGYPAS
ncbi:MAG: hypothetical protein JWR26_1495 [Pedosphaera sp.]|nr:hypothetical protein [Pedosphaera sp.]